MKNFSHRQSAYYRNMQALITLIATLAFTIISFSRTDTAFGHEHNLRLVAPWEIKSTDLSKSGYIYSRMEIIETLTSVNCQGTQIPCLATKWSIGKDKLQWRFELRKNVTFHDGTPLTAKAVVNALNIAMTKPGMLNKMPIKSITQVNNTILISLVKPCAILDAALSHYSAAILSPSSYAGNGEITN